MTIPRLLTDEAETTTCIPLGKSLPNCLVSIGSGLPTSTVTVFRGDQKSHCEFFRDYNPDIIVMRWKLLII